MDHKGIPNKKWFYEEEEPCHIAEVYEISGRDNIETIAPGCVSCHENG
jgi:hypothetical protein